VAGRGPAGTINFNTSSKRAVLCFPHVKAYDPATDANVNRPLSQFLAGVIAATDAAQGYWYSPSNKNINGAIGAEIPLTAAVNDPSTDVNLLNENGIVTVFNSFGSGLRTWGNRSAAYPSSTTVDNFIAVQRVADIINESVENSMLQFIDEPITNALIDAIVESVNSFIRTLKGRNAILDGKCSYDPDKNPEAQVSAGKLLFDIEFMPPVPGERYTFNSFINIEYLSQLGGNQ
jgi:phage tail sheath protein FI